MTIWNPTLKPGRQKYLAIADALERDIEEGQLTEGQQLPTHRELADSVGVTIGTVTRAYSETERRGLTVGEVGRGTFVRRRESGVQLHRWGVGDPVLPTVIDMRHSLSPELGDLELRALESALSTLSSRATTDLMRMPGNSALERHREAGADWLRRCGLPCTADEVLLSCGIQHGLTVSLMTLLEPRDVLLTEEFTYPGLKSTAAMLGIRLRPIAMDEEGVIPEAIERACRIEPRPRALYVVPTIQNPTCGTLSPARRTAVAKLAQKHDLIVIEDQIHALLPPERPAAISSLIPERSVCLASPSKSIAPGLRLGFMRGPSDMRSRLLMGINSTIWTVPPLAPEIFSHWIESGTVDELMAAKRTETSMRHSIVDEYLSGFKIQRDAFSNHLWLTLPESWSEQGFVRAAREAGVLFPGSETFAVGRSDGFHAARISIGTTNIDQLRRGLSTIVELLSTSETPVLDVI